MTTEAVTPKRESVDLDVRARAGRLSRSPVFYGIAIGLLAVAVGQWGHVSPPAAYGLCSACHGRDLSSWLLNHIEGKHLFITAAGAGWPVLTVVGVVLGSLAAAKRNGEFGSINIGGNARMFIYGGIVMGAALFVGGCPTRILIRTGFGDVAGILALGGVAAGIVAATVSMRWVARR
ncbi:MAG TPA: YeeE/YedE thiosulfate transporter family protein [Gaiellaceae bacterium]